MCLVTNPEFHFRLMRRVLSICPHCVARKKSFFFWIFFRPRFRPKFWKCPKRLQVTNLQESTWNFFERHFYTQRNVLNTLSGIFDDIAAIWKSLPSTPLKKQEIWCGLMRKIADFLENFGPAWWKNTKILASPKFHIGGTLVNKTKNRPATPA